MPIANEFGQYCPLSMAAQVLGSRWTMLILREILIGNETFNDISRGIPRISRTLLSQRLKQLVEAGVLVRNEKGPGLPVCYVPTKAGQALGPILRQLSVWAQEWVDPETSLEDADTDVLMWDMRCHVEAPAYSADRFVVRFCFPDALRGKKLHWMIFESKNVDVCYIDPGYDVDVYIEADLKDMIRVWMGWVEFDWARENGLLRIDGAPEFTEDVRGWMKLSGLAGTKKRPSTQQILRRS